MIPITKNLKIINILAFLCLFFLSNDKILSQDKNLLLFENKAKLIITSQIKAFKNRNVAEAYSFASPFIKSKFANAVVFGSMVKSSYPMIWAPKEFKFLEFNFFNESLIQRVLFIDKNDQIFMFDYEIKNYGQDQWLINGVYQVNKPSSGA